jgi:hypothetical protein
MLEATVGVAHAAHPAVTALIMAKANQRQQQTNIWLATLSQWDWCETTLLHVTIISALVLLNIGGLRVELFYAWPLLPEQRRTLHFSTL